MNSVKMNGGSFKLTAVLAYRTEAAFVKHYDNLLSGWMTEDKRKKTLRQVYRIARALKKQQDDNDKKSTEPDADTGLPQKDVCRYR